MLTRRRIVFGTILALPLVAVAIFELWLSYGPVKSSVVSVLSKYARGTVEVEKVSFRWRGGLVLRKIRLRESKEMNSPVVCEIQRADVHGSLVDVLRGRFAPSRIEIRKPTLRLRIEPKRNWSDILPLRFEDGGQIALVPIELSGGRIEFIGPRPAGLPASIDGISLAVSGDSLTKPVQFVGAATDPLWGNWRVTGTLVPHERQLRGRVRSTSFQLKPDLATLLGPQFAELWRQLDPAGQIAVDAEFSLVLPQGEFEYQVLVDPSSVSLQIPTCNERARDVTGRIEFTPQSVRIHALAGSLASGEVIASGTISRDEVPTIDAVLEVRRIPINRLVAGASASISGPENFVSGKLTLRGTTDPQSWDGEFRGELTRSEASEFDSIPLHLVVREQQLMLDDLAIDWAGGKLRATARVPLERDAVITGTLDIEHADLSALLRTVSADAPHVYGNLNGRLTFEAPLNAWRDPEQWRLNGPISLRGCRVREMEIESVTGKLVCSNRVLSLTDATAKFADRTVRGRVNVRIEPTFPVEGVFRLDDVPLSQRVAAATDGGVHIAGTAAVAGVIRGQLIPLAIQTAGSATFHNLSVDSQRLDEITVSFSADESGVDLSETELSVLRGRLRVSGRWDRMGGAPANSMAGRDNLSQPNAASGRLTLRGRFDGIDIAQLVPRAAGKAELRGNIAGTFTAKAETGIDVPSLRVTGSLASARLAAGDWPISNVRSDFSFENEQIAFTNFSADHAAGKVTGSAVLESPNGQPVLTARLSSTRLDIAKLLPGSNHLAVRGAASGNLAIRFDASNGTHDGRGSVRFSPLIVDELPPIDSVTSTQVELANGVLHLRACQANLWGGTATGTATIHFADRSRIADVVFERVENVELSRLLVAWPAASSRPRGKVSGAGKLQVVNRGGGPAVFGQGEFQANAVTFVGLPVQSAEGTIDGYDAATHEFLGGRVQPRRGNPLARVPDQRMLIRLRDARAARGTIQGVTLVSFVRPVTYDTNLQFSSLDLATVVQYMFASPHAAGGSLTGNIRLHGTERGSADNSGEMYLRVQDAQLWSFPPLAVLGKLLTGKFGRPGGIHTAEVRRAVIVRDTVELQEFWMSGDLGQLAGQGKISLDGDLELDVVGNFKSEVARNVPVIGQIQDALSGLQQRLVKFRISGTVSDPTVVPVPLQDLSEPAIRILRGLTGALLDNDDRTGRPMRR